MSHPDSNLHPEATGPAKALVDRHRAEQPLKLLTILDTKLNYLSPVQRVWLALEEKQIPYEYIEVNPYNKPDSLLALNPRGLVPTLSCPTSPSPRPLYESTVILEYLEDAYPGHGPRLLPTDPYERARARIWIDYVTSRIIPAFHRFLQYQPTGPQDGGLDRARQEFLNHLKVWTKEMHSTGPFFLGQELSAPDLVLAPWAVRLWVFDEFKGGIGIPSGAIGPVNLAMAPETKDGPLRRGSFLEPGAPETPAIHPSFIQVAKPYIFEQTIQDCIEAMGVNPMREESLRLQGVTWIDNVRKVLRL
ncbi:Glutathione S-transferase/chloride channel C-terminal [Penicillium riverlandense]|uniref:Glutathione S-transferase/chloride channel C-terminal n=1 Tax=Penicillium riverlandense TaxID=1903569 RepID=UPI002547BD7A|nr:Glutathione S-transferase/chloride channel C-terminal [Penicillium riverlandense]KAJ5833086.1 Glutathione S-transferase/chloride channel C-terminal [Penicillium riverlandense]